MSQEDDDDLSIDYDHIEMTISTTTTKITTMIIMTSMILLL